MWFWGLLIILLVAVVAWLYSVKKNDVSIVDSLWPLLFLFAASTYALTVPDPGPRRLLIVILVGMWALRLSAYITWRNWVNYTWVSSPIPENKPDEEKLFGDYWNAHGK